MVFDNLIYITQKKEIMKTIKNTLLMLTMMLLITVSATAVNTCYCNESQSEKITLHEEAYINDIPFDTGMVVAEARVQDALQGTFHLEDEKYIDDIPFDTRAIAGKACTEAAGEIHFPLEEEPYINDIPFDTSLIVAVIEAQKNLMARR